MTGPALSPRNFLLIRTPKVAYLGPLPGAFLFPTLGTVDKSMHSV